MSMNRRRVLQAGLAGGAALAAGARIGLPTIASAAEPIKVTFAGFTSGVAALIGSNLKAKRPDLKHGVDIVVTQDYSSVANYYNDLAAGTFDLGIGAWDTFYQFYAKGVPIKLVATATSGNLINVLGAADGPDTLAGLKGKTLAAVGSSGSFAMTKVVANDTYHIDLGKDVTVQSVANPALTMTLLLAGNVDAGLAWEPYITNTLEKNPKLKSIFNLGEVYEKETKKALPYFAFALRTSAMKKNPDLAHRLSAAIDDLTAGMIANPEEAFEIAAPHVHMTSAALMAAHKAGRLKFLTASMATPEGQDLVRTAYGFLRKAGGFKGDLDAGFFAT